MKTLYGTFHLLIRSKLKKNQKIKNNLTACFKIFHFALYEFDFKLLKKKKRWDKYDEIDGDYKISYKNNANKKL